jgi:hypothetical protein
MMQSNKRPDTPLAATPEPMPVSSGLQPMAQQQVQPISKYQATADKAIQQISNRSKENAIPVQPQVPQQPQQP